MKQYNHIRPYIPHMITTDTRKTTGWIAGIIAGRFFEAKVYDNPSTFGVNDSRVSKLSIGKTAIRNHNANYMDQLDYNYDRGLDFSHMDEKKVNKIVEWLNQIPLCDEEDMRHD